MKFTWDPDWATRKGKVVVHIGVITERRARCRCKWRGIERRFEYQAREDLLSHFRKIGTLVEAVMERHYRYQVRTGRVQRRAMNG